MHLFILFLFIYLLVFEGAFLFGTQVRYIRYMYVHIIIIASICLMSYVIHNVSHWMAPTEKKLTTDSNNNQTNLQLHTCEEIHSNRQVLTYLGGRRLHGVVVESDVL